MKHFEIDIEGMGSRIECVLTPLGEKEVRRYLRELKAKRKEILDAGKDTADNTNLPTEDDIISDIETWFGTNGLPEYCNSWSVTDEHEADYPLCLHMGHEIITAEAAESLSKMASEYAQLKKIVKRIEKHTAVRAHSFQDRFEKMAAIGFTYADMIVLGHSKAFLNEYNVNWPEEE